MTQATLSATGTRTFARDGWEQGALLAAVVTAEAAGSPITDDGGLSDSE